MKSIAIIIDKEGWAYDNTAHQIKKYLSKYYDIDIIPVEIFEDNVVKLFLLALNYDLMFIMWRGIISWLDSEFAKNYINKLGFEFEDFLNRFVKTKNIVTGVYDHLFLETEKERTDFILQNVKDYFVSSEKLKQIYNNFEKKPSYVIADGVDLELFKLKNENKYKDIENKKIIIGWTGNSKFKDENDDDLKGINKVIKPAIEGLIEKGYNIELKIADRNVKLIPHDEMPDYYNEIDLYVCASRTEGTPNPVLEAMACGIPIISTDVGIVSEVFGKEQKNFIIERTKESLQEKIEYIINNKSILEQLSKENLEQIKNWSWKNKTDLFKQFFDDNINKDI